MLFQLTGNTTCYLVSFCYFRFQHFRSPLLVQTSYGEDWAQWRGANRDAKSNETGLLENWPEDGPHSPGKQQVLAEGIRVSP